MTRTLPVKVSLLLYVKGNVYCIMWCLFSFPPLWSLRMNTKIESPATCAMWSVIRFLNAKNVHLAEIQLCGEGIMNEANVKHLLFKEGRT
jgi:hypothetical protein